MTDNEKVVIGSLLKEYRRIRVAYYYNIQNDVSPPSWELEKSVLRHLGYDSETLEFQKNKL